MTPTLRLAGCLLGALLASNASAQTDLRGPVFTVLEENDLVLDTDRHYTQGIKFAFLHAEGFLPGIFRDCTEHLPRLPFDIQTARIGYQVGQNIYTPSDYSIEELQPNDRPYAGWLYGGLTLQRRGLTAGVLPTLDSIELQLGIIGPESLAEQAQTWIHELRRLPLPQGWDNQIDTEPGIALRYQHNVRLAFSAASARYLDLIPHLGFSLGNVETSGRLGITLRAGYNLPEDFGVQTISSLMTSEGGHSEASPRWSVYAFTSAEGWAVGYTAFLDGNLWHDSHSVEKENWVAEWNSGLALGYARMEIGVSHVFRTDEFVQQTSRHAYGSIWFRVRL